MPALLLEVSFYTLRCLLKTQRVCQTKMGQRDDGSGCSTSGRSDSTSHAPPTNSPSFERLFSRCKAGRELVRLWHGSEDEFSAAFHLGELVGEGGFALVRKGKCPESGEEIAVKIVDRLRYGAQHCVNLEREIAILQQLDHPHLVRLKRVYLSPPRVYIVTELLTGGELLDQLMKRGKYHEQDARRMMEQLLQAVDYLHSRGIAHRDLKLENLLLATPAPDAPLKIADFGLSKCFSDDPLRTICGSPQYVAPEVLTTGLLRPSYGCAADLWSLGVILFILLAGFSPFDDDVEARVFERIRGGCYSVEGPLWQDVSGTARAFVRGLLCVDPNRRLTAAEALQHPWIRNSHERTASAKGTTVVPASPPVVKPKMSPRRPTIKALDKLVLQNRSPNQSGPATPYGSPPASPCPGSSPKAGTPDSPCSASSFRGKLGEHSKQKLPGSPVRVPASPRGPAPLSSPLGRPASRREEIGKEFSKEVKSEPTPASVLAVQIGKLLR